MVRIVMLDLLVEREAFGHGGNLEALTPFTERHDSVECLLLTPQMQAPGAQADGCILLTENDVPRWDDEYPFWSEKTEILPSGEVHFKRICMPSSSAFESLNADAVICSGSRRNVSMWEPWMDGCADLLCWSVQKDIPTLGICFGHQLLAAALGGKVTRAEKYTDVVSDLDHHANDVVVSTCGVGLFTHQDHVTTLPENVTHLASAGHCGYAAFRVNNRRAWGVQFHPEAARARIERSFKLGHITADELAAFERDHDGAELLAAFSDQVGLS